MHILYELTGLSLQKQKQDCRWLCHQNFEIIEDVFKTQKFHFFKLKDKHPDINLSTLSMAAFFLALNKVREAILAKDRKSLDNDITKVSKATKLRAKQHKQRRADLKLQKLLNIQNVILTLIVDEKYSYRQVASYLQRYHHFEVSHSLVGKVYNIIKGEDND